MTDDKPTINRIKLVHPKLRDEAKLIYQEIKAALTGKAVCRFTHTLRTFAEQDALFNARPQVTKAKGGHSYHNYGLAIDVVLLVDKDNNGTFETASWDVKSDFDGDNKSDWMEIVAIFKRYGWEWGGDWKFYDAPHFQKTFGKSIVDLLKLHNSKKFISGTTYVEIG
jgi:peptidoglycan L-alanyl-D-glutamate endopeptidase CwlK